MFVIIIHNGLIRYACVSRVTPVRVITKLTFSWTNCWLAFLSYYFYISCVFGAETVHQFINESSHRKTFSNYLWKLSSHLMHFAKSLHVTLVFHIWTFSSFVLMDKQQSQLLQVYHFVTCNRTQCACCVCERLLFHCIHDRVLVTEHRRSGSSLPAAAAVTDAFNCSVILLPILMWFAGLKWGLLTSICLSHPPVDAVASFYHQRYSSAPGGRKQGAQQQVGLS